MSGGCLRKWKASCRGAPLEGTAGDGAAAEVAGTEAGALAGAVEGWMRLGRGANRAETSASTTAPVAIATTDHVPVVIRTARAIQRGTVRRHKGAKKGCTVEG